MDLREAARNFSIFEPGRNCRTVAHAKRAAFIVDAADYFKAFAAAAQRATRSIIILAWDFDSRTRLTCDDAPRGAPAVLGDFLNFLVKRRRGLHIYVLDWDYPMVFGTDRESRRLGFGWKPRRRVHMRFDDTHAIIGSHHQKIVVIDDRIAFSGGLDLTSRRWDTCEHRADDERRLANGAPYPPFHDLMVAVDDDAARTLGEIARERWRFATGRRIAPVDANVPDPWPDDLQADMLDAAVGISLTVPAGEERREQREVEALYIDMIARARRYIYIENQYFTANKVAEAIAARLAEPHPPEILLVLRLLSHGWLEEHTMHVLRTRLIKMLRAADRHQRFQIYYPHVPGLTAGTCVDVHSKAMIVDDEWLRIGSANLSNRSMGLDTECDLTFEARGETRHTNVIRNFRDKLLSEHLNVAQERVRAELERSGSLLATVGALRCDDRSLSLLEEVPEWSDTVIEIAAVTDPERPVALDELITQFGTNMTQARSGPAWGKLLALALVIGALTATWHFTPIADYLTTDRVMGWAQDFAENPWAPLIVLAAYTPACFIMFPRPVITLFAVVAFGPYIGFTYAMSGILIATLITFYVGKVLDYSTVRSLAGEKLNSVSEVLRKRGLLACTALRLVPLAPFAVEGIIAGAIGIKLWHLLLGTFIGMLPGTLTATIFGDQIETALRDPSEINYWFVGGALALLIGGSWYVRRWFMKNMKLNAAAKKQD